MGVDPFRQHVDFAVVLRRKDAALVVVRAPPAVAVVEVEQHHRIAHRVAQQAGLRHGRVRPVPKALPGGAEQVFEEVDDGRVVQVGHVERGAEPAVGDDEVRLDVGPVLQRLEHSAGVGNGCLEPGRYAPTFAVRSADWAVNDLGDAVRGAVVVPRRREGAQPAVSCGQPRRDVAELSRKVGMDEQDVHVDAPGRSGRRAESYHCVTCHGGLTPLRLVPATVHPVVVIPHSIHRPGADDVHPAV